MTINQFLTSPGFNDIKCTIACTHTWCLCNQVFKIPDCFYQTSVSLTYISKRWCHWLRQVYVGESVSSDWSRTSHVIRYCLLIGYFRLRLRAGSDLWFRCNRRRISVFLDAEAVQFRDDKGVGEGFRKKNLAYEFILLLGQGQGLWKPSIIKLP